jgi:hypothetical protein
LAKVSCDGSDDRSKTRPMPWSGVKCSGVRCQVKWC